MSFPYLIPLPQQCQLGERALLFSSLAALKESLLDQAEDRDSIEELDQVGRNVRGPSSVIPWILCLGLHVHLFLHFPFLYYLSPSRFL